MIYTVQPKNGERFEIVCESVNTKETYVELVKCFIAGAFYDSIIINTEDIEIGEHYQRGEDMFDLRNDA